MEVARIARRLGNELYKFAFPIYRPLYGIFKTYGDRVERELLSRYISAGSVVVDAGANIGIYSQFFSKHVGPNGTVHSFEPAPENFARLEKAVSTLSNVRANQLAVGDKTGDSLLYLSDELNVDHRAYPTESDTRKVLPIRSTTLDDYFKPGERVDLIKMDIQGYELQALRGAQRVLEENATVKLLLEFWPYGLTQAGVSAESLISFLHELGFSLYLPTKNGLMKYIAPLPATLDPANYFNLFGERKPNHPGE